MNGSVAIDRAYECQAPALQHLHQATFWQGWDEETFRTFLRDETVSCLVARPIGMPENITGFILVRQVADEAEIITLAVARQNRRQGVGYALLDAALRYFYHQRVQKLFLEVEEKNHGALSLYRRFGFEEMGRRRGYYQTAEGRCDALMMCRFLVSYTKPYSLPECLCNPDAR